MQGKDFLYFLVDEFGRSFYVENGIVQLSAQPRPLEFTPEGWEEITVQNVRNQKYFALDRNFTLPLDFVEDGAIILKDAYYKKGLLAKVFLVISKQELFYDGIEYGYHYKSYYRGALDFTEFNHVGPKVTISITEAGPVKYIKANENAVYEFEVDVPEAIKIKMDGIELKGTKRFIVIEPTYNHGIGTDTKEMIPMQESTSEGYFFNIGFAETAGSITDADYDFIHGEDLSTSDKWNGIITDADTITMTMHMEGMIRKNLSGSGFWGPRVGLDVKLETSTGRLFTLFNLSHDFGPVFANAQPWAFSVTSAPITLLKDETFFIYTVPTTFQSNNNWQWEEGTVFEYLTTDRYKTTYIKALPPLYLFKKLVEKVTGGRYQADSTLLAQYFNIPITCGDAIRGIAGAKIKTSLSQFFQAMNTVHGAGMGEIGGVVRLETKGYWVDYTDPIDLGEVKELSVKPAAEYLFNLLRIGYQPQDYDDVNGRQEFNNTNQYTGPEIEESKTVEFISPYRADCYGAEFQRLNLEGKTTTDSDSDNDVFMIHTTTVPITDPVEGQVYELNRNLNTGATGLLEPDSVFNIFLSPARCLQRNGSYIHSCFYKMDAENLIWQTTDKNPDLVAGGVVEKANVNIGSLASAFFTPNILEFEAPSPVNLVELLAASPARAFKFSYLGIQLKGIAVKVGIRSADYAAQTFTLLSAPDNDLEQLINVME